MAAKFSGSDFTSGAVAAAVAETVAAIYEDVMWEDRFDDALKLQSKLGRPLTSDEQEALNKDFGEECARAGRFTALATAFILEHDVEGADFAATNAVDNNFIPHAVWGAIVVGGAIHSAFQIYNVYVAAGGGEDGAVAALKQLGFEVMVGVAGGMVIKAGIHAGKPAVAFLAEYAKTVPLLNHALKQAHRTVTIAADKIAAKTQDVAGAYLAKVEQTLVKVAGPKVTRMASVASAKIGMVIDQGHYTTQAIFDVGEVVIDKTLPRYFRRISDSNRWWKGKIHGKAQITGGMKNPDYVHAKICNREAVRLAKRQDVVYVQMDLGINRLLPNGAKFAPTGNKRPDITYMTKDGRIHQIEVQSKTDTYKKLMERMENTNNMLPPEIQGTVVVKMRFPE